MAKIKITETKLVTIQWGFAHINTEHVSDE